MTVDLGLTHIALPVADVDKSIEFYATYARMRTIHRRVDIATGVAVVWLSDFTRPFAIVLIQTGSVQTILSPIAHLGVGCKSREDVDVLCARAKEEGVLIQPQQDSGYPIGYWAFLRDLYHWLDPNYRRSHQCDRLYLNLSNMELDRS